MQAREPRWTSSVCTRDGSGGCWWAQTIGIAAPVGGVALPKPPIAAVAPALDGRVILRREATENHYPVEDWHRHGILALKIPLFSGGSASSFRSFRFLELPT